MFEVLKSFKYSPDGIEVLDLKKGDIVNVKDNVVKALTSEGYIKAAKNGDLKIKSSDVKIETKPALRRSRTI